MSHPTAGPDARRVAAARGRCLGWSPLVHKALTLTSILPFVSLSLGLFCYRVWRILLIDTSTWTYAQAPSLSAPPLRPHSSSTPCPILPPLSAIELALTNCRNVLTTAIFCCSLRHYIQARVPRTARPISDSSTLLARKLLNSHHTLSPFAVSHDPCAPRWHSARVDKARPTPRAREMVSRAEESSALHPHQVATRPPLPTKGGSESMSSQSASLQLSAR